MEKKGLRRDPTDKFYTRLEVVDSCLVAVRQYVTIHRHDLVFEPSAGNGAFIGGIQSMASHGLFYDLEPEHPAIVQQDFLTGDYSDLKERFRRIHVVGNPPFGRQSSMAIRFIKKSCEFCDSISFILPRSFKKNSLQRAFPLFFHLEYQMDLPEKSFLVDGVEHDVPCVFQVWIKKSNPRALVEKLEPLHFEFVDKREAQVSFRRVGVNAGLMDTNLEEKSPQSHYFLRFHHPKPLATILQQLSHARFDHENTVGPRSISKQELIAQFNPLLDSHSPESER